MHEREPSPVVAAPPAPAHAAAPVAAPPGLVGMPAVARSLQRTIGNRLVSRALAQLAREGALADAAAGALELDDGGAPAPAPGAPTPTFDHSGGTTVTINADSAVDFSRQIVASIGAPHVSPEFTPDIQTDFSTDASGKEVPGSRKISSIGLTVKTSITKVRFGLGRVDDDNRAMIARMVTEIQAHEQRHRSIVETAATAALAAAQKFVGTNKTADAKKALTTTLECTTNTQHEALDASEGLLTVTEVRQPDGKVTLQLTKSGSGAKYPCKK